MQKMEWKFSCLLVSTWKLDLLCPPLEIAQSAPLVAGQGLQGGKCFDLEGTCGPCAEKL